MNRPNSFKQQTTPKSNINSIKMANEMLTLRISGMGHKLTLEISSSSSLLDLKEEIETQTKIPAAYQRLIHHGKTLTKEHDDSCTLGGEIQLQDRTKIMLLHNEQYAADKDACEEIQALKNQLDELQASDKPPRVVHELVTQICCKLDAVDIHGSEALRKMRKQALKQAESLDHQSG